jgi:hypothetical protein
MVFLRGSLAPKPLPHQRLANPPASLGGPYMAPKYCGSPPSDPPARRCPPARLAWRRQGDPGETYLLASYDDPLLKYFTVTRTWIDTGLGRCGWVGPGWGVMSGASLPPRVSSLRLDVEVCLPARPAC